MSTPHIAANIGEIAQTVLMPGDPLRAKFVADSYLTNVVCVNEVRNMFAFTGDFQGKPVTVMGGGMGIPSTSIYCTELFRFFEVENIIRVGSCGSIHPNVNLGDLVVGMGASTDSVVNRNRFMGHDYAAIADFELMRGWIDAADARGSKYTVGNIFSSDTFYHPSNDIYDRAVSLGILAVEMEAAGLYRVAAEEGGRALTVLTVSDHIIKGEKMTAAQRESSFGEMMEITLASIT